MDERLRPDVTAYALVNGLRMYYEIYGRGQPLLLLHGGMTTVEDFGLVVPVWARTRRVIAFERQGHGHTADIDRPFDLDQWADDTAALLRHLDIEQADLFGYSTGGSVALAVALRHPRMVGRLVLASAVYHRQGYYPGIMEGLERAIAGDMPGILREMYTRVAPHPEDWPKLVEKSARSAAGWKGWSKQEMRTIGAPTLVMVGDSDIVRTEHAVELYRLIPDARLAVLPDTDHTGIMFRHAGWTAAMVSEFLDAPVPEKTPKGEIQEADHDFPTGIGRPATNALLAAGYTRLEQLAGVTAADIQALHGVGPKAIRVLRAALAEKGLAFRDRR